MLHFLVVFISNKALFQQSMDKYLDNIWSYIQKNMSVWVNGL